MEPLFVTECKFDNKSYYEMVPILRKKPSRNRNNICVGVGSGGSKLIITIYLNLK